MKLIIPKLPMRSKEITRNFFVDLLEFQDIGEMDFKEYLIIITNNLEIHFFEFKDLNPLENYGQIYIRTESIAKLYEFVRSKNIKTSPLEHKPWKQIEFSIIDPDHNLITFGQSI